MGKRKNMEEHLTGGKKGVMNKKDGQLIVHRLFYIGYIVNLR